MKITRISELTGRTQSMDIPITEQQYYEYMTGTEPIQQFFPDLDPDQREFIMTGITSDDWERIFREDQIKQTK